MPNLLYEMEENGGTAPQRHTVASAEADASLQQLGIKSELNRNSFSLLSMLGMAFAVVNTWCGVGTTINASLPSGGPSSAVWGLVVAGIFNLCCGVSLAEFLSAYPTAGGQYHWAAIASWKPARRAVSYITGWINLAAWVCLAGANCLLVSGIIMSYAQLMYDFEPTAWQRFLLYVAIDVIAFSYNLLANRFLSHLNKWNMFFTLAGFIMSLVTILACAAPKFQHAEFIFGGFINQSGWPDGWAWQLGLLQGAFSVTAYDSTIHMIEEMPNPTTQGPRLMVGAIVMAVITGFGYIVAVVAVMSDIDSAISAPEPLLEIYYQATQNKAGSICLMMFPCVSFVLCAIDDMATSARMAYSLARDNGMPFSRYFEWVSPTFGGVPAVGLVWCFVWDIILGLIFLGSSDAFNAIVSAAVVCFTITYAIPPGINMLRRRRKLPENRSFKLPTVIGYICNAADVAWALLTVVLFVWPTSNPTDPVSMNYCVVAFGVIIVIAGSNWILSARKSYKPPTLELVNSHHAVQIETEELTDEHTKGQIDEGKAD